MPEKDLEDPPVQDIADGGRLRMTHRMREGLGIGIALILIGVLLPYTLVP